MRGGQLTCLNLLSRLPTQHQADFVVRMYARIEEKFNSLLREDLIDAANNKCEWRGVNRIAFIPCFNNYFVVSTSQNKMSHAFRCFLDIDFSNRFVLESGDFLSQKEPQTHLSL